MPLSVDEECSLDEQCAEILRPWDSLGDDEFLEVGDLEEARRAVTEHVGKLRALRIHGDPHALMRAG